MNKNEEKKSQHSPEIESNTLPPPKTNSKKRTKKRKMEGNLEKPVTSAYSLFTAHTARKLKEKNPEMPFTDISRKVSELWKTPELKQEWERKHANLMIDYIWNLAKQREGQQIVQINMEYQHK